MALKECPFCGQKRATIVNKHPFNKRTNFKYVVFCKNCWCETDAYPTKKLATNIWNARSKEEFKEAIKEVKAYENK